MPVASLSVLDLYIIIALFGLLVGSFLNNVLLLREKDSRRLLEGRSMCPMCKRNLRWWELVPVVSFLALRARCWGCSTPISWQYPLVEAGTALLFLAVVWEALPLTGWGSWLLLLLMLAVWALLLVILIYDLWYTIIPNPWVFSAIGLSGLALFIGPEGFMLPPLMALAAGPILFAPFYLLWRVSAGRWIGLGDAKLAWLLGWLLGFAPGVSAIVFSFWLGALVGVALIGLSALGTSRLVPVGKSITMKSEVPFAPFMIMGAAIVYFFDVQLMAVVDTVLYFL